MMFRNPSPPIAENDTAPRSVTQPDTLTKEAPTPEPGTVFGRLINVPASFGDRLEVHISQSSHSDRVSPDADGQFHLRRLIPGPITVYISCRALDLEIARFEDVQVISGESVTDPRFAELDVADLVRLCHLSFETTTGEAFHPKRVHVLFDDASPHKLLVGSLAERDVLIPAKYERLSVLASGYFSLEALLVDREMQLRFQPR